MRLSPVLSPQGRPVFSAGGKHAWKVQEHRGWIVSLEWVGDHRRARKCMVIWPASNILRTEAASDGMWVISDRAITQFVGFNGNDRCTGSASDHCYREAQEALPLLGKDRNDRHALLTLIDAVVRFAPDLVMMPVAPPQVRREFRGEAMWEVVAKNKSTGRVMAEAEV